MFAAIALPQRRGEINGPRAGRDLPRRTAIRPVRGPGRVGDSGPPRGRRRVGVQVMFS
jgi:hypothetical protein